MITDKDISVVIQGAVDGALPQVIESVRRWLPCSEVILSTWVGTPEPKTLPIDVFVVSDDPGAQPVDTFGVMNNVNRQLVSTVRGLQRATRPYALKLRTDFVVSGLGFVSSFEGFPRRDPKYSVFANRLVVPSYATRVPDSKLPLPFHPSDLSVFGRTGDLIDLFDVPHMTRQDMTWWASGDATSQKRPVLGHLLARLTPEQHFFIECLKKHDIDVGCKNYFDSDPVLINASKRYLVNNYVIEDIEDFGVFPLKPKLRAAIKNDMSTCFTSSYFRVEYRRYADPAYRLSLSSRLLSRISRKRSAFDALGKHLMALKRHFRGLLVGLRGAFTGFHQVVADVVIVIFHFLRALI